MIRNGQTVTVTRKDTVFHGRTGTVKRISFLSGEPRYLVSFGNGCLLPYDSYINDSISIFR